MRGGSDLFSKLLIPPSDFFLCRFSLTNYLTFLYCLWPLLTDFDSLNRSSSLILFAFLIPTSPWLTSCLSTSLFSLYEDICFLSPLCSPLSTATTILFSFTSSYTGTFLITVIPSTFYFFPCKCWINCSIAWFLSAVDCSIKCRRASWISNRTLVRILLEVLKGG